MADEAVTLEFISRQLDRVTDRIGAVENKITVLTGSAIRVDGSIEGLATEVRGMYRMLDRMEHRLRKLEDHVGFRASPD